MKRGNRLNVNTDCSYADLHISDVAGAVCREFEPEGINSRMKRMTQVP